MIGTAGTIAPGRRQHRAPGGTAVMVGVPKLGTDVPIPAMSVLEEKTILGCVYGSAHGAARLPAADQPDRARQARRRRDGHAHHAPRTRSTTPSRRCRTARSSAACSSDHQTGGTGSMSSIRFPNGSRRTRARSPRAVRRPRCRCPRAGAGSPARRGPRPAGPGAPSPPVGSPVPRRDGPSGRRARTSSLPAPPGEAAWAPR